MPRPNSKPILVPIAIACLGSMACAQTIPQVDQPLQTGLPDGSLLANVGRTMPTTPPGYFASGWPIALAEAACGAENEACLTLLANCGPSDQTCSDGVALCDWTQNETRIALSPCASETRQNVAGINVTARISGHPSAYLTFAPDGSATLNGVAGRHALWCIRTNDTGETFCARPLKTTTDLAPWAPDSTSETEQ